MLRRVLALSLLLLLLAPAIAQDMPIEPVVATITADDGVTLVGDFYAHDDNAPTVMLMHMLGSQRSAWLPLIPALLDAGYNVLNVDLRGHGESEGSRDWDAARADIQLWLQWLREQPAVDGEHIAIIGASIGANLALIGCADDEQCVTAIALSPGEDYRGVQPAPALTEGLAERSALLIGSQGDGPAREAMAAFILASRGNIAVRLYDGRAHGTNLFNDKLESVQNAILAWLEEHLVTSESE